MAVTWKSEMTQILRNLIMDNNPENETYADDRLYQAILTAAQLVQTEVSFPNDYTINVSCVSLTPDPTSGTRDDGFINLVSLKAACIIATGEYKVSARMALSVKDGPSVADGRDVAKAKQELSKNYCEAYQNAKLEYQAGYRSAGEAIVGPHRTIYSGGHER
jgi:hypothetical protein